MGRVIYCETKETTTPYIFGNTRIAAYSYEEICYYIFQNPSMISFDALGTNFIEWVREKLQMTELADRLSEIYEGEHDLFSYLETLLLAANYYTKEEVSLFFEKMKAEAELPEEIRLKRQADGFLRFHKYVRAIRIYDSILEREELDAKFRSTILHNKGVALSKNFELEQAADCYVKAYETYPNEISLSCYLSVFFMLNQMEKAKEEANRLHIKQEEYERILKEYERTVQGYEQTLAYQEYVKAMEEEKYGQDKKARMRLDKMLSDWKEDYRTQTS